MIVELRGAFTVTFDFPMLLLVIKIVFVLIDYNVRLPDELLVVRLLVVHGHFDFALRVVWTVVVVVVGTANVVAVCICRIGCSVGCGCVGVMITVATTCSIFFSRWYNGDDRVPIVIIAAVVVVFWLLFVEVIFRRWTYQPVKYYSISLN